MHLGQREASKVKIKEQASPNKWQQKLDGRDEHGNGGQWKCVVCRIRQLNSLGLSATINTATAKNWSKARIGGPPYNLFGLHNLQ